jgi:hypothetical protein
MHAPYHVCLIPTKGISFRSVVGSLYYVANATRPDIYNAVRGIAGNQESPTKGDWLAAKRILRYLNGTRSLGLCFGKGGVCAGGATQISNDERDETDPSGALIGYCDASWGGDPKDRRSVTGYLFMLHHGVVSWHASRQRSVALSSAEAEYMAVSDACKEAVWLRNLLVELRWPHEGPVVIREDNQAAIQMSHNPRDHSSTKHIDIRYHHIRERISAREVMLDYVGTANQTADVLTKALPKPGFLRMRARLAVG